MNEKLPSHESHCLRPLRYPMSFDNKEIEEPTAGGDEVLIRVRAASVNPLDWHYMRGAPYPMRIATGLCRPKITRLGTDLAGRVEAVGRNVTRFQWGDEVFGASRGSFAEYVCALENRLALKPADVTFDQAAALPSRHSLPCRGFAIKDGFRF
jgi:NADPH:quinone reductase-like Zn-dependent oxidoreductase